MNSNQIFIKDEQVVFSPVFDGLEALGFSGLDIAKISCVSPPTVSKWRNGYLFAPNEFIVLLTLVLASRLIDVIDENEDYIVSSHALTRLRVARLKSAREDLEAQEKINYNFPSSAIRTGTIRFRYWWHTQQRLKITDMQMTTGQVNQPSTTY